VGTESVRRGIISILLIFALALSMSFTAAPVLAPGVPDEPGGDIIEVGPGQEFTLRFKLRWDIPGELGYFSLGFYWDSPRTDSAVTPSENFTFVSASAYLEDNLDTISTNVIFSEGIPFENENMWRYSIVVDHTYGYPHDDNFFVDIVMRASGYGGVLHVPTDNHPIVISGTIDVVEGLNWYSYLPPNPYITIRVLPVWRLIETWTVVIEALAEWQLIETWTGTVEAPAGWQLVETWTGTVQALAEWQLIDTWNGIIQAPVGWQLIESWDGAVESPAQWQFIETWTGTVEALAEWQLIETWTGAVQSPAGWQLIEMWTGVVEAPAEWQLIETWTGTVGAPAEWQLIEIWVGTVEAPDTQAPPAPTLLSPADGTTTDDNTPTFDWSDVTDPSGVTYTLEIRGMAPKTGLTDSTYMLTSGEALSDGNYSWRVQAVDGANNVGDWSDTWSLTVSTPSPPPPPPLPPPPEEVDNVPPPIPSLISPADNENITDNTPLLDWSDVSDLSGVTYDLSIAGNAGFTSIVLQKTDLTASAYDLTSAEALAIGTYYWRVRGVDGAGNVGPWSENWSFKLYVPPKPALTVDIPSITTDENATIEFENTAITGMTIDVAENVENVRITVQQLTDRPAEIAIGALGVTYVYLSIVSENITDADIDIVLINFRVEKAWITAEDVDPDSMVMRRWDSVAGVWVSLPTTRIGEDDTYHYYRAESPGLSVFSIGYALVPAHAKFEFSNLMINPSEVRAGKAVTISVVVANVGDLRGSYNVILKIDNIIEAAESVTLAGGAMRTVTFTVSSEAEGPHDIEVEGLAGTFVVTPAPPSIVPLAITGGIVLLAGILIWLRMRRTR